MINAQSLVCSQHLEQQLNRDIEDKSSGRLTVERRPALLMLKPYLFKIYYKSLTLATIEIRSPLNIILLATTCPVKQTLISQRASGTDICLLLQPEEKGST